MVEYTRHAPGGGFCRSIWKERPVAPRAEPWSSAKIEGSGFGVGSRLSRASHNLKPKSLDLWGSRPLGAATDPTYPESVIPLTLRRHKYRCYFRITSLKGSAVLGDMDQLLQPSHFDYSERHITRLAEISALHQQWPHSLTPPSMGA